MRNVGRSVGPILTLGREASVITIGYSNYLVLLLALGQ